MWGIGPGGPFAGKELVMVDVKIEVLEDEWHGGGSFGGSAKKSLFVPLSVSTKVAHGGNGIILELSCILAGMLVLVP